MNQNIKLETVDIVRLDLNEFENRKMYWTEQKIIEKLKELPKDIPINKKILLAYNKKGLICHVSIIQRRIGTIREACKLAGLPCCTIEQGSEKGKYMSKLNTKWTKEKILSSLKKLYDEEGWIKPTDLVKYSKQKRICHPSLIGKHFGTIKKALDKAGIKYKGYYWTNERIIKNLFNLYEQYGAFAKTEINTKFRKKNLSCGAKLIRDRFGSLEKAAEYAGIEFSKLEIIGHGGIGKNEKQLLDKIEQEKGIELIRQYRANGYYIDGYDQRNNIAYEIDELHHKYNRIEDSIREQQIKEVLSCDFVRIKDNW